MSKKEWVNVAYKKRGILEIIAKHEPEGRHVIPLSKDINTHRATASRLCGELANDNWIKRENKQAPYHLTQKAYGDPGLGAFLFSGQTARRSYDKIIMSLDNKFCNKKLCGDISDPKKSAHTDDIVNELLLFEFVNRIGAWVTYIMMQAVRPDSVHIAIDGARFEIRKGKDKDKVAETWIDSIKGMRLFYDFEQLKLVKRGRSIHDPTPMDYRKILGALSKGDRKTLNENSELKKKLKEWLKDHYNYFGSRRFDPFNPLWSYYEMNKEDFDRLARAFRNLYPRLYEEFETIRKGLPHKIQKHKEWDKKYLKEEKKGFK
ncbi:MAG TPA: hypothetical protein VFR94_02655 [Nitrososphaeraceae archaeon]|nr:hypothetical protein [Nitrososphaeraceae archaeon]